MGTVKAYANLVELSRTLVLCGVLFLALTDGLAVSPVVECETQQSGQLIESFDRVTSLTNGDGARIDGLEGARWIRSNAQYDTSGSWGDTGRRIRNFWGALEEEPSTVLGSESLLGLDPSQGVLNVQSVDVMFGVGVSVVPGSTREGNDFVILELGGSSDSETIGNDDLIIQPLNEDGIAIEGVSLSIDASNWGDTGKDVRITGDGVNQPGVFRLVGVGFDVEDFSEWPTAEPVIAGLRILNSVDLAAVARNTQRETTVLSESRAVPVVDIEMTSQAIMIDQEVAILSFSTSVESGGSLIGPVRVGTGGQYGFTSHDAGPAIANFWGASSEERSDLDGTLSLLGVDLAHGLINVHQVDVLFGYEIDASGVPGTSNDLVVFELGNESFPDAPESPPANNTVELVPLDRHGDPIGDFRLTVREEDWGDVGRFRIDGDTLGEPRVFRMVGVAMDFSDFAGTGTLSRLAGLRCIGRDPDGVDLATVAYGGNVEKERVPLPGQLSVHSVQLDEEPLTLTMYWFSKPGDVYAVETSDDGKSWTVALESVTAIAEMTAFRDPIRREGTRTQLYRVRRLED